MKHTIMLFLAGALFAGFTAELDAQKKAAPAKAAEVKSQTPAIMKKLNEAANRKNLDGITRIPRKVPQTEDIRHVF